MTLLAPDGTRHLFHDQVGRSGDLAVVSGDLALTYGELSSRVDRAAEALGADRRLVAVEAANRIEALVAYLGAMRGGHVVLLLPPGGTTDQVVDAYDPDVIAGSGAAWEPVARRDGTRHSLHPDLALLMSTSGSTGSPKLVRLSHENLAANAASIVEYLGIGPGERAITTLPMQYCYGLSVVHSHLLAGASLVLTELSVVDRCFWDLFARAGATSLAGVPHTFDLLDRVGFDDMSLPTLRHLTQAGGRMAPERIRHLAELGRRRGFDLFVMYGQTEATARMAYLPPALAAAHPHTIGVPIPGGALEIDEPDADGVGELVYRGANVMMGYAERPEDLARGAEIEELRTGDLARRTPEGLLEVVGRRSRFVKPFGLRVDLDRVERLLSEAGIPALCAGDDEQVVVAVAAGREVAAAREVVARHVDLPPTRLVVAAVDPLPRLANGKPDHAAVRALATSAPAATARTADGVGAEGIADGVGAEGTPDAAAVRRAFSEVLGVPATDDDTFVGLGGDSLSYVEMSIRLERLLGTLPRDWHVTRLGDLRPADRPRRRLAPTDTTVVVRAVAIVLVVATHVHLWHLPGGAHALLALAGYNLARFQLRAGSMARSIARVAVPSVVWIGGVALVSDTYGWPNALLVHGWLERPVDKWGYWFVEALVQILVVVALLLAVPGVRRFEQRHPFALPMALTGLGLLVRFGVVEAATTYETSRPVEVLWLFSLGWAAARAPRWPQRLLVSLVAAVAVHGWFGDPSREAIILGGILLVTWVPTLPLPRAAQRLVAPVAAASLFVYLTHYQVFPPLDRTLGPEAAVVGSVVAGIAAWWLWQRISDRALEAVRVRRVAA